MAQLEETKARREKLRPTEREVLDLCDRAAVVAEELIKSGYGFPNADMGALLGVLIEALERADERAKAKP